MADPRAWLRKGLRRALFLLLPKNPWLRLLVIAGPLLLLVLVLAPSLNLLASLVHLLRSVVEPLLHNALGRMLAAMAVLLGALLGLGFLLRQRVRTLRSQAALARHLLATQALLVHGDASSAAALRQVARYRGPAPEQYPHLVADARLKLARIAWHAGQTETALGYLARIVPASLPAALRRSHVQLRCLALLAQDRLLRAAGEAVLQEALCSFPRDPVLLGAQRDFALRHGDLALAITAQEKLLSRVGHADPHAQHRLVELLRQAGSLAVAQQDEAAVLRLSKRLQQLDGPSGSGALLRGDLYLAQGELQRAVEQYALASGPAALRALQQLLAKHPGACSPRELLRLCPRHGTLLLVAADLARAGRHDAAQRAAQLAALAAPAQTALLSGDVASRPEDGAGGGT